LSILKGITGSSCSLTCIHLEFYFVILGMPSCCVLSNNVLY